MLTVTSAFLPIIPISFSLSPVQTTILILGCFTGSIVSLCHQCHQSTHIGLAGMLGKREEAESHLKQARNFTDEQVKAHIKEAFALWRKRNECDWKLDITIIAENCIKTVENNVLT